MAKCRKCNAEIPKGKELCRECEKLNKESYLDSLLNAMTSKEQTPQESVNARKLRFERMREKFAESTAGNVEQANEDVEPEIDLPSQLEPEPEVDLQPELEPGEPDATEALEEIASAEDGLLPEEGALKGEEELPAPEFGVEPEPEADLQPELEPEPEADLQPEFEPEAPDATEALEEIASAEDGLLPEEGALKGEEELPAPEFGMEPEPEADLQPELEPGEPDVTEALEEIAPAEDGLLPEEGALKGEEELPAPEFGMEPEPEADLQPELEPGEPDVTEALEEIAPAEDGLLPEEGALKGEEELPAPEFGMEPEPEVDLQPELELEPELFKDILPSEDKDIDGLELAGYYEKEAMPLQENTVLGADSMRENELEENDKYLLTPEEEKAFDLDIPDDFDEEKVFGLDGTEKSDDFFKGEWENRDYDVFHGEAVLDQEFDRMFGEIADTIEPILPMEGDGDISILPESGDMEQQGTTSADGSLDMGKLFAEDVMRGEEEIPRPELSKEVPSQMEHGGNDISDSNTPDSEIQEGKENSMTANNEEENLEFNDGGEPQEDILDLINSIYNSEEGDNFDGGGQEEPTKAFGTEDDLEMSTQPDDLTDFFSEVMPAEEELSTIPDIDVMQEDVKEEPAQNDEKKKKKEKKGKKNADKKPGILKRVFGNIRPERTEEEIAQMKEKVIADAEAKDAEEEEKKRKAAEEKEAKKKKAAEDKAASAKQKQENAKKKAEAAKAKKEAKKEAKDKKKQEVQNLIDAIDENEGRINRVGASIVFVFFAAVAVAVIIGTNIYAYSQSIENAQKSFEFKHYNEAYDEIAGLNVKEEDQPFTMKVMVVMYTYKQLNSFNNYYKVGLYPEALDSLLKGLERYDKYSALASVVDVTKDMDAIREEILEKLESVYSLTEEEAMQLVSMKDHAAYTEKVYGIAGKIAKNDMENAPEAK